MAIESLLLDPTLQLNVDFINPGLATQIRLSGAWFREGKIAYFDEVVTVPGASSLVTNFVLPVYSDNLIGLSLYHEPTYLAGFGCFAHAYLKSGFATAAPRVIELCSGWISNSSPLSYPMVERGGDDAALAPLILRAPIPVAGADVACATPIQEKALCVGFRGTFTADINVANRFLGLQIDDGTGQPINIFIHQTAVPALSVINVFGVTDTFIPFTIGADFYIPIPQMIFNDEFPLSTFTQNIQAGDIWSNVEFLIRPFIVH